jgi:hypothetical protein
MFLLKQYQQLPLESTPSSGEGQNFNDNLDNISRKSTSLRDEGKASQIDV